MSSLAASGGYWISADADQIWAQDSTLTGSIGVFGMIPTFDRTLAKIGVHTDGIGTTPLTSAMRGDMPMTADVQRTVQLAVEKDYRRFIEQVAKGRQMPADDVDKIARGRVWSGLDAKNLGLVDNVGGEHQAVLAAAKLAGLKPDGFRLEVLEAQRDLTSELLERFTLGMVRMTGIHLQLPGWLVQARQTLDWQSALRWVNDPQGLYAHCLCAPTTGRLH
jgi:protease-4